MVIYLVLPKLHELEVVVPQGTTIDGRGRGDSDACDVDDSGAVGEYARLGALLDDVVHG